MSVNGRVIERVDGAQLIGYGCCSLSTARSMCGKRLIMCEREKENQYVVGTYK